MKRGRLAMGTTVAAGLALFAFTWWFLFPTKRVELRWKLQPGQVLRYRIVASTGGPADSSRQECTDRVTVASVERDGAMVFTHVCEQMTIMKSGSLGTLDYSSSRGDPLPKEQPERVLACLVGMPLEVRMDPRGELLDIKGVEEQELKRIEAAGKENFMGWLTAYPLRGNPLTTMIFPARPLAIGESWTQEDLMGSDTIGKTRHRTTFTLVKVEQDIAELEMKSDVVERTPGQLQRLTGDLKIPEPKHTQEHRIRFSLKRGVLLSNRDFSRIDTTTTKGQPFHFEALTETTLVEK
jgi:hypothetical protein